MNYKALHATHVENATGGEKDTLITLSFIGAVCGKHGKF